MQQRDYWDQVAEEKTFTTDFQLDALSAQVRQDAAILEIGCGYGRILEQLWRRGYRRLLGIDHSEKMIARGRRLYPDLDLRVGWTDLSGFPAASMDAVIVAAVLTCIVENIRQAALLKEIERILVPGGILYVNDFLLNDDSRNRKRYEEFASRYGVYGVFELPEGAVLRHHDAAWVRESLASFETVAFEPIEYRTMNGHVSKGYWYIGRKPE